MKFLINYVHFHFLFFLKKKKCKLIASSAAQPPKLFLFNKNNNGVRAKLNLILLRTATHEIFNEQCSLKINSSLGENYYFL